MKKFLLLLVVMIFATMSTSCTDAKRSKVFGYGDEYDVIKISPYNGDTLLHWVSTGKVKSEKTSDGYYFKDKKTGKLIEVSGDLIIISK